MQSLCCDKVTTEARGRAQKISNMKNHVETHIEGLSYSCPICSKMFSSKNSMSKHKSVNHKP